MNFPSTCGGHRIDIDPLPGKEGPRILDAVNARRLDLDLVESRLGELRDVFVLFKRSGHAAHPEQHAFAISGGTSPRVTTSETANRPPGFRTRKASCNTRSLSPERLITQLEMITSTRIVGQRDVLDFAFEKFDVLNAALALVLARERQHFVGHVEAVGLAGGADAAGGQQHIDAAARAEIEDRFAGLQLGQRGGVAAAERGLACFFRYFAVLRSVVEVRGDGIAASIERAPRRRNRNCRPDCDAQRRLAVLFFYYFFDFHSFFLVLDTYRHRLTIACGSTALLRVQHSA